MAVPTGEGGGGGTGGVGVVDALGNGLGDGAVGPPHATVLMISATSVNNRVAPICRDFM